MHLTSSVQVRTLGRAAVTVASLAVAPPASAQCVDDNLDTGACCQVAPASLPAFPAVQLPGLGINWTNCTPTLTNDLVVGWPMPIEILCGHLTSVLSVREAASGLVLATGTLDLNYTRTWQEVDPLGNVLQVWRFAAKADVGSSTPAASPPCPIPNCIAPFGPHPTAFFYGYVDYVQDCGAAAAPTPGAVVLHHACDLFIHGPALSDKPGTFHPASSFGIVAPHSSSQPFVPGNQPAPGGPNLGEATRDVFFLPIFCSVEDKVGAGAVAPLGGACLCSLAPQPKQQTLRQVSGTNSCPDPLGQPGSFQSLQFGFPTVPWFHLVSTSMGTWLNASLYPGNESAWVDEGLFVRHDACVGDFVSIEYGGSTRDGFTVLLPQPVVVRAFLDLASNYGAPIQGPFPFPVVGSVQFTEHLIYLNQP